MNTRILIGALTALLIASILAAPAAMAADWGAFQKDKHNTGLTSDKAPITNPYGNGISWEKSFAFGGWSGFDEAPVVVGDTVYVVGADNKVRAMNKTTGVLKWETPTSGGGFLLGNMGAGDGTIFVPTSDGKIFGINDATGVVEWSATESGQMNTPVVYDDHKIYFGDSGGNNAYYCYSDDGTEIWQRTSTSGSGYYWAGAATIGDYLVYGDDAGHLTSVYKASGNTVEEMDVSAEFGVTANEIRSSICYVEDLDRIYFTSKGGYIYALGMNDDGTFDTIDKHHEEVGYSTSTPAVHNNKVYVGAGGVSGGGNGLSCLDADLTNVDWHFAAAAGAVQSSPAITTAYDDGDGEVYIYFTTNTNVGKVYCVNESGVEQWSWGESGKTSYTLCGVAISDGWIFYGTDSKYVFGFATTESLLEPCLGICYAGTICEGTQIMVDVPCWECLTGEDRSWKPTTNCPDRELQCPDTCIVGECPACANGIDDDGDGLIDCNDPQCACCCDWTEDDNNPTPCVPELATFTLLALGLVMLVGIVRFGRRG